MELLLANKKDIKAHQTIWIEAYSKNFKNHWIKNGFELYIEDQFNEIRLISDIKDSYIDYFFITLNNNPVGFLKIKTKIDNSEHDCELEKIYILPKYLGQGIGKLALQEIIKKMQILGKKNLQLDVIDTNTNAILFYKTLGFIKTGTTTLDALFFKEKLRGMFIMRLDLN